MNILLMCILLSLIKWPPCLVILLLVLALTQIADKNGQN